MNATREYQWDKLPLPELVQIAKTSKPNSSNAIAAIREILRRNQQMGQKLSSLSNNRKTPPFTSQYTLSSQMVATITKFNPPNSSTSIRAIKELIRRNAQPFAQTTTQTPQAGPQSSISITSDIPNKGSINSIPNKALRYLRQAVQLAEEKLNKATKRRPSPQRAGAAHHLVELPLYRKSYDSILATYQHAVKVAPDNATFHFNLGNAYLTLKRYDEALTVYQRAVELAPDNATYYFGLGDAYSLLNHHNEALRAYQRAIELAPNNATYYFGLGSTYSALNRHNEALTTYQQAIKLAPNNARFYYELGSTYSALNRHNEALRAYQRAIKLAPNNATYYLGLGDTYSILNRHNIALRAYQRAIKLAPDNATYYFGLGDAYSALNRHNEALTAYQQAIKLAPNNARFHFGLSNAYSNLGRYEEAIIALSQAIQITSKNADLSNYDKVAEARRQAYELYANETYKYLNQSNIFDTVELSQPFQDLLRRITAEQTTYTEEAAFRAMQGVLEENPSIDKATFQFLQQALREDPILRERARQDPDFDFIRNDPRFRELFEE